MDSQVSAPSGNDTGAWGTPARTPSPRVRTVLTRVRCGAICDPGGSRRPRRGVEVLRERKESPFTVFCNKKISWVSLYLILSVVVSVLLQCYFRDS